MKSSLLIGLAVLACCAFAAARKSWDQSYQLGLDAAKAGHWGQARQLFQAASQDRKGDSPRATMLPGSPTEPVRWRDGAAYSPDFLAAYCAYRDALSSPDLGEQTKQLTTASVEFEHLLDSGEDSRDTYFFLDVIYSRLGEADKRDALNAKLKKHRARFNFRVDEEPIAPEEVSAMSSFGGLTASVGTPAAIARSAQSRAPQIMAGENTTGMTGTQLNPITPGLGVANVPLIPEKFALVVSETGEKLSSEQVPYAAMDADTVKNGLINYAGYAPQNVVTLHNPKAADIMTEAKALAQKVPQDGTVMLFYSGPGSCLNGKDYITGAEAESLNDPEAMVSKLDLYSVFMLRGARLFCFFEVDRPIVNGFFFGSEVPQVGAISQMEATIPDGDVTSIYYQGAQIGLFAESFREVLAELRSNRVPIYEFGWQLYNKMRRGNSGTSSGASHQIPTLPVLNNLAADSRF